MGRPIKKQKCRGWTRRACSFIPTRRLQKCRDRQRNPPCHYGSGCRTAGDFCQAFRAFPDRISQPNARLDPSKERGTSEATDKPSLSPLLQLLPRQQPDAAPNNFLPLCPLLFSKEAKLRVARLKSGQLLFQPQIIFFLLPGLSRKY